MSFHKSHS